MSDRIKLRELVNEWAAAADMSSDVLARAIMEAALDGEFDALPDLHGVTFFDDVRLSHVPVCKLPLNRTKNEREFLVLAGLSGQAWLHRDGADLFARSAGRGLPAPNCWVIGKRARCETPCASKPNSVGAAAEALKQLFPHGRPHHTRQELADRVCAVIGKKSLSARTIDRAIKEAWPSPISAKVRPH